MFILNIDTSIDKGSFCVVDDSRVLAFEEFDNRMQLAGWLHVAIDGALKKVGLLARNLDAVAVSNGPGSYTGLRIGLAAAKGFCYALNIPLICVNTLQIIANAAMPNAADLICPMIDARRMEVFTAIYDKNLTVLKEPYAEVLNDESFGNVLKDHMVLFTGNGSEKFKKLIEYNSNARFVNTQVDARDMISITFKSFKEKKISDVAYGEPHYVKDVYINKST